MPPADPGKLRLLYVADGRSPIALNWIQYFIDQGHEVHLASTFPCKPDLELASLQVIPVAGSEVKSTARPGRTSLLRRLVPVRLRTALRQWFGPLTLPAAARSLSAYVSKVQPDLVHAMRIPFEGMLAAAARPQAPLLVSTWGNDFTLHAASTPRMARETHRVLARAAALHSDCQRDAALALQWGYPAARPVIVLPGGGGLHLEVFYPPAAPVEAPVVIDPRGIRAYVRTDTFFQAAALVIQSRPEARFLCPTMAGEAQALEWVDRLGLAQNVDLLPRLTSPEMAEAFRSAAVACSPSEHDGTPNTLLEAMACGCFPVAGNIPTLHEWIEPGKNGLLADPSDPQALANALLAALADADLRRRAAEINLALVRARAEYGTVMAQADAFYRRIV